MVNYAPRMHHMNVILDAQQDGNGTHDSNFADPDANIMRHVESMMQECAATSKCDRETEHALAEFNANVSACRMLCHSKDLSGSSDGSRKGVLDPGRQVGVAIALRHWHTDLVTRVHAHANCTSIAS